MPAVPASSRRVTASVDRDAVLAWADRHLRDLPWRRTRDPWAVLVSEVMAQQTGVARVIPFYEAFLERFPTPGDCAAATPGEVLRLWSGLGYNRRAVNLHRCARVVVERHGGRLPDELAALLVLPGVGPYTARAVLAFAFERRVGVVDTNVGRVLARWTGGPLSPAMAQDLADDLVLSGQAWRWNQALMELGGAVCRRRRPDCAACPARAGCGWASAGLVPPDPADGSAGVGGGQAPFEGSDRQGRGRLVEAVCRAPVPHDDLPAVMGWPHDPERAARVAAELVADGLAMDTGDSLVLP